MPGHKARGLISVALCLLLIGCGGNPAPRSWRRDAKEMSQSVRGGWVVVTLQDGSAVEGELVAVDWYTLHVNGPSTGGLVHIKTQNIQKAKLYAYETRDLKIWTLLGTLSTISHGFILVFTAPAWILVGSLSSYFHSKHGYFDYGQPFTAKKIDSLRLYTRFPQGLPPMH